LTIYWVTEGTVIAGGPVWDTEGGCKRPTEEIREVQSREYRQVPRGCLPIVDEKEHTK
jgi:hypothetical protein